MVPIKEAINSGAWLLCEQNANLLEANQFRLRINLFRKIHLSEIDGAEEVNGLDSNSTIWLLGVEIVNLNKTPLRVHEATNQLILIDQDGFSFPIFEDHHLHSYSEFGEKTKLKRFWLGDLLPKIKAVGSLAFQLPDDDEATYSIGIKNHGIVKEV